ncbi:MAG TPA: dihydrofolate reductase family protein [Verrucomicrobiae bacterium]|nr:dihydrofolate reductase family protein [Verrucomicrobiae bacterium]
MNPILKNRPGPLPFVFLNLAMTADGKIATANRKLSSFSSARDRRHMMELRATADAVMSGARTVDLNSVTLGPGAKRYRRLRLQRGLPEYNLRIVASRNGSLDPKAYLFQKRFSPIVVLTTGRATPARLIRLRELADDVKVCGRDEIDFRSAFRWLRRKWKVRRLLCEGGGELDGGLFQAGVVNELHLTICPKVFGGREAPTIADGIGVKRLAGATQLRLRSAKQHGKELFLVYRVTRKAKF